MKAMGQKALRMVVVLFAVTILSGYVAWRQKWWNPYAIFTQSAGRSEEVPTADRTPSTADGARAGSAPLTAEMIDRMIAEATRSSENFSEDQRKVLMGSSKSGPILYPGSHPVIVNDSSDTFGDSESINQAASYLEPTEKTVLMPSSKSAAMPLFTKPPESISLPPMTVEDTLTPIAPRPHDKLLPVPSPPKFDPASGTKSGRVFLEKDTPIIWQFDSKPLPAQPTPP